MSAFRSLTVLSGLLALGACVAAPTGPSLVAMPGDGKDLAKFQQDDVSCRQYGAQQSGAPAAGQTGSVPYDAQQRYDVGYAQCMAADGEKVPSAAELASGYGYAAPAYYGYYPGYYGYGGWGYPGYWGGYGPYGYGYGIGFGYGWGGGWGHHGWGGGHGGSGFHGGGGGGGGSHSGGGGTHH